MSQPYAPRGATRELFYRWDRNVLLEGPAGCVAGHTRLWDPIAGEGRRIDELQAEGRRPWVLTLNGPVRAGVPFLKGWARLYRLQFSDGSEVTTTGDHRMLTRQGWAYVEDLCDRAAGTGRQSECLAGAPRSMRTGAGSQAGHLLECRSGGGRPLSGSGSAPGGPPSQGGDGGRSRAGSRGGALVASGVRTPACQSTPRPSTQSSTALSCTEPSPEGAAGTLGAQWSAPGCSVKRSSGSSGWLERSPQWKLPQRLGGQPQRDCGDRLPLAHAEVEFPLVGGCDEPGGRCGPYAPRLASCASALDTGPGSLGAALRSGGVASDHSSTLWVGLEVKECVGWGPYYDLYVPGEEHYLAEGLWHHNTGKSFGAGHRWRQLAETYPLHPSHPAPRFAFCRATRKSMTDSVLVTWEKVLGKGHAAITGRATRALRHSYTFPNGTYVGLFGLSDTSELMSTEWDGVWVEEARQVTKKHISDIRTRLRNHAIPHPAGMYPEGWYWEEQDEDGVCLYTGETLWEAFERGVFEKYGNKCPDGSPLFFEQLLLTTNPDSRYHHINRDAINGDYGPRLKSRHSENPTVTPEYLEDLQRGDDVHVARFYRGEWTSAHGQIWEGWDEATHVVEGVFEKDLNGTMWVRPNVGERRKLHFTIGGQDWGWHPDPGVAQVWGVDMYGCTWLLVEIHQCKKQLDWWADRWAELQEEFGLAAIVCDPSQPGSIEKLNDRMGHMRGRDGDRLARKADNSIEAGLDTVRWYLTCGEDDQPRLRVLEGSLRHGACSHLVAEGRPWSFQQEVPAYTYLEIEEDKPNKEKPNPMCKDDACDVARYVHQYVWGWGAPKKQAEEVGLPDPFAHVKKAARKNRNGRLIV